MWKLIYKSCFQSVNDNTYKWFQYRIIHRIIGTKKYLKMIKQSDCDQCRLCGECEETSLHLFSECYKVQNLWQNINNWIESKIGSKIILNNTVKTLGYYILDEHFWPLNVVLLITRHYIFNCARNGHNFNVYQLQKIIKSKYEEQTMLQTIENCGKNFERKWSVWQMIYDGI